MFAVDPNTPPTTITTSEMTSDQHAMSRKQRKSLFEQKVSHNAFSMYDVDDDGELNRAELKLAVEGITGQEVTDVNQIEMLLEQFDTNNNGTIDPCQFRILENYLKRNFPRKQKRTSSASLSICMLELAQLMEEDSDSENWDESDTENLGVDAIIERRISGKLKGNFSLTSLVNKAVGKAQRDNKLVLQDVAQKLYSFQDILCIQDANFNIDIKHNESKQMSFDDLDYTIHDTETTDIDPDFLSAFAPSAMRCLALVSHNGMKKTMREFVTANRNVLKKFRLTGTNSTMTMLQDVFKDEPPGTVMFGPSCASGPLGGDAELVALLVAGKIGGIFFFQDPMNAHPHRADIDCLVRQALVHNTMIAETPVSALMMLECMRNALMHRRAELIPSFFFSLQSPSVEAYKVQQKAVVDTQRKLQAANTSNK